MLTSTDTLAELGPLSPEEHAEMNGHPLSGCSMGELKEDLKWYSDILEATPTDDPAYGRMKSQFDLTTRYIQLKERYDTLGVAGATFELTQSFIKS